MTKEDEILEEMREFYGCEEHGCSRCPALIEDGKCNITVFVDYMNDKEDQD